MNIPDKITGNTYTASEFTQFKNEVQNAILASGQSLASNSDQLKQAITRYANNGASYTDAGTANSYVLNSIGSNEVPSALLDGMVVSFKAGNANTGSSTIQIQGLPAKPVKKNAFADNLVAGDISVDEVYIAYYDSTEDAFLITSLGVEKASQAEVDAGTDDTKFVTPLRLKELFFEYLQLSGDISSTSSPIISSATTGSSIYESKNGTVSGVNWSDAISSVQDITDGIIEINEISAQQGSSSEDENFGELQVVVDFQKNEIRGIAIAHTGNIPSNQRILYLRTSILPGVNTYSFTGQAGGMIIPEPQIQIDGTNKKVLAIPHILTNTVNYAYYVQYKIKRLR